LEIKKTTTIEINGKSTHTRKITRKNMEWFWRPAVRTKTPETAAPANTIRSARSGSTTGENFCIGCLLLMVSFLSKINYLKEYWSEKIKNFPANR
jgi:hypothetical protein